VKMIVQAKNMSEVNFGAVLEKIRAVKAEMENSVELMAAEIDKVKAAVKEVEAAPEVQDEINGEQPEMESTDETTNT